MTPLRTNYNQIGNEAGPSRPAANNYSATSKSYTGLSRVNQLREKINFEALKSAVPSQAPVMDGEREIVEDTLVNANPNETIKWLNNFAVQGFFFPLTHCVLVIKKFSEERFGTFSDVEHFYQMIHQKYPNRIHQLNDEVSKKVHGEMILVYAKRNDRHHQNFKEKAVEIYNSFPHTWTRNTLLTLFEIEKNFAKIIELYRNWPDDLPKDHWTHERYLLAIKKTSKEKCFFEECDKILVTQNIQSESFKFLLNHRYYKKDIEEILQLYHALEPEYKNQDENSRLVMQRLFDAGKTKEALEFFYAWPCEIKAQSFLSAIKYISGTNLKEAIAILEKAYSENKDFRESLKIDHSSASITLNLHYTSPFAGGTPKYSSFAIEVVEVMLWHLYTQVLPKMQNLDQGFIGVTIITGKGKEHLLRKTVAEYTIQAFKWKPRLFEGRLGVRVHLNTLYSNPLQMPEKGQINDTQY